MTDMTGKAVEERRFRIIKTVSKIMGYMSILTLLMELVFMKLSSVVIIPLIIIAAVSLVGRSPKLLGFTVLHSLFVLYIGNVVVYGTGMISVMTCTVLYLLYVVFGGDHGLRIVLILAITEALFSFIWVEDRLFGVVATTLYLICIHIILKYLVNMYVNEVAEVMRLNVELQMRSDVISHAISHVAQSERESARRN